MLLSNHPLAFIWYSDKDQNWCQNLFVLIYGVMKMESKGVFSYSQHFGTWGCQQLLFTLVGILHWQGLSGWTPAHEPLCDYSKSASGSGFFSALSVKHAAAAVAFLRRAGRVIWVTGATWLGGFDHTNVFSSVRSQGVLSVNLPKVKPGRLLWQSL